MQRCSRLLAAQVAATTSVLREANATNAGTLKAYDDAGLDYSATSTKEFLQIQSALIPYRIVRLNEELKAARELGFGALPGFAGLSYHLAIMGVIYVFAYIFGRRSLFAGQLPPKNEAQLEEAKKVQEARQEAIMAAHATAETKRLARLEKDKAKEEQQKVVLEAAVAAAEEARRQKALARERGY